MKLLPLLLIPVLAAGTALAQHRDVSGRSRFWDFYEPHPSDAIGSRQWWTQADDLTGDWWGMRNLLDADGVSFSATYTNNIAGNPVGGKTRSATYTDNLGFGANLDFGKLIGWPGASLVISGLNRAGTSLSQVAIGNQFTVQQVYGEQTVMFFALAFEQKLWDDRVSLKLGRFAAGDDFASSPLYWIYMNNGIDGNPQALPVNTKFSTYPVATWGGRLRLEPSRETTALFGIYQTANHGYQPAYHGLDWSIRPGDGVFLIAQLGWTPTFFPPGSSPELAQPKDAGKQTAPAAGCGYPAHFWFGAYYSPWDYGQFGTAATAPYSYGFYWHADQMVFREKPGSDQGLTIWSAFVYSPQQSVAKLPFQANAGLVYQGLVPSRDQDQAIFGAIYGLFSSDYARSTAQSGGGSPSYELDLEWGYRIQFSKFLYVQPDLQWVINPGGAHNIPNALVLGAQCGVTF